MLFFAFILILLLNTLSSAAQTAAPTYNATDFILLNCGSPSNTTDRSNRNWDGDARSKYAPPNSATISQSFPSSRQPSSVKPVPYQTARVFTSDFTYSFPVLAGPKFLRLYFFPDTFSTFNTSQSFFSVTANQYTLLKNFSAFLNSPDIPAFMKEYVINVGTDQRLNLTFSPNPNSFAFINGIEIVSVPDTLYFQGNDVPIKFAGQIYYLRKEVALENVYRLNVGGSDVEIQDDTGPNGMFRAWSQDDPFIFGADFGFTPHRNVPIHYTAGTPPYTAPEIVYTTSRTMSNRSKSLEWAFEIDSGFYYLLRFHFCEIQLEVTEQNQRQFTISVDNQTEELQADVISWTGGPQIPIFRDYIAFVPDDGRRGRKYMRLSLSPMMQGNPKFFSALLNGLEIFKISGSSDRSLAAANPDPSAVVESAPPMNHRGRSKGSSTIYAVVGSVIGVLTLVGAISFLIFRRRRRVKVLGTTESKSSWGPLSVKSKSTNRSGAGSSVPLPSDLCHHFLIEEIKSATGDFDDNFIIGKGGFGNVYKGYINIDGGSTAVAIKRLNPSSKQGANEFQTEIHMLSKLRHLHLVSLIGYCDDNGEMILVYDYMANGTLRSHLYNSDNPPMTWKQRLQICIGAAKGLHHLHTGAKHTIIHRDVKSTNILLDEKFVAKVSDFGLSKVGPTDGSSTHVSTVVKGSIGYMDPEYYRRQQLTDKSDVYSFGVVLLEVLCARPAVLQKAPREEVNLAEWGRSCYRKGKIEKIVDPNISGKIAPECLSKFVETTILCLKDKGFERPTMYDVVGSLEFAMQLQEAAEERASVTESEDVVDGFPEAGTANFPLLGKTNTTDDAEEMFSGSIEMVSRSKSSGLTTSSSENFKTGDVFSELFNPIGR